MKKQRILSLVLAFCMIFATAVPAMAAEEDAAYTRTLTQQTPYGPVTGTAGDAYDTLMWKGIPYAQAPVGELRFKAPAPIEPWSDVLEATETGPLGIQLSGDAIIGSEDCLNLDIYRPNTNETGLPILVFLHGGNNQTGTSAEINPEKFVVDANCIVISLNYRLGMLGFNTLPALKTGNPLEDSGNYTLLDIHQALTFIEEIAPAFGGDSQNITISGFSAGGRDVMALLISPMFEGKFQKAISFSGGMTVADPEGSQRVFANALAPLVVEDGIRDDLESAADWLLMEDTEVRDYLCALSAGRIAAAIGNAGIRMSVFPHLFTDGAVLPKEGFDTNTYVDVPLLMVTGSSEFSNFAKSDPYFARYSDETILTDPIIYSRYRLAKDYGGQLYGLFNAQESAQKMIDNYTSPIYTCDIKFGDNEDVVGREFARLYGSYHGMWIPLMTGMAAGASTDYPHILDSAGAKQLQSQFAAYIGNFLWQGDPNGDGLVTWAAWTSANEGPSQLILDADKDKAIVYMSEERADYDSIIDALKNDISVTSEHEKNSIIKTVLNGRWFSNGLDQTFNTPSLWP